MPKAPSPPEPVRGHDILVLGTSAGGVEALRHLVADLPADLPAAVFIVLHTAPGGPGLMPQILRRNARLKIEDVRDGDPIRPGHVYIAPPDHHLLVDSTRVRVTHGPKENRHRPAIDPLFRSAATIHGPHVIGALLTGTQGDGAAGLWAVKACGGLTVVQDPGDALFPDMVLNALRRQRMDHMAPLAGLGKLLTGLVRKVPAQREAFPDPAARERFQLEATLHAEPVDGTDALDTLGEVSSFTCPECNGALWQMGHEPAPRFRCHTGHAYSAESLRADQDGAIERALYTALKAVEENVRISHQLLLATSQQEGNGPHAPFRARVQQLEEDAETLRQILRRRRDRGTLPGAETAV